MKQKLDTSKKRWKIVCGHHTWRSIACHGNAEKRLEIFLDDLFKDTKPHLYMCGHDHNKQVIRMEIDKKPLLLIVCGTGGKKYHKEVNYHNRIKNDSELQCCSNNLGYGEIIINGKKMKLNFLDENNKNQFAFNYSI